LTRSTAALPYVLRCAKSFAQQSSTQLDDQVDVKLRPAWSTPKSHERRSVPFPRFLSDELAVLMVGKRRDDLVFAAQNGGVLRLSHFRPECSGQPLTGLWLVRPSFRG
jgi:hypothetical protein